MKFEIGQKVNLNLGMNGRYKTFKGGDVDFVFDNTGIIQVAGETEKAVKFEKYVSYKNKSYTTWIPKAAIVANCDDEPFMIENWFVDKLGSFENWLFNAK